MKDFFVINIGETEGTILGGNLRASLTCCKVRSSCPLLKVQFYSVREEDHESKPVHFDRDLVSLTQHTRL